MSITGKLFLSQKLRIKHAKQTADDAYLELCITCRGLTDKAIDMFLKNCEHIPKFNKMEKLHPDFCSQILDAYLNMVEAQESDYGEAHATNALPGHYEDMKFDEHKEEIPF